MVGILQTLLFQYSAGPFYGIMRKGMHAHFKENLFDLNAANDGALSQASRFHALIVLRKNDLSILAML